MVSSQWSYEVSAFMKYTLPVGHAEMIIIEADDKGNIINQSSRSVNNGAWKWHFHSILIEPNWKTKFIQIRFAVGGEEKAYLDIDRVEVQYVKNKDNWKEDIQGNSRYYYGPNNELKYILLTDGKIVSLEYNNNGALVKKRLI
ncbi:hypothetical protein [Paenibacillus donghaensis]|nr:hypothetical protein [Paenibacillus donghaensis]